MTDTMIKYLSLQEDQRHNLATEEDTDLGRSETVRSNLARETETQRHNQVTESVDQQRADTDRMLSEAKAAQARADAGYKTVQTIDKGIDIASAFIPGIGEF